MKLERLDLKAVGPFTDVSLDFTAGHPGLHIIYGPNEAGKSSSLRAVSYLLFGFPHLSADNFVHPNEQLRIGGTLRHSDGDEIRVLRRRGRGNTLRGADDATVVAEERFARFVGGVSPEMFQSLFGINHERLSRAGEEIRTGKGQLGELLFAAGAGLAGLRKVQETVQARLDELFKPHGKNPKINKSVAEFRAAVDEVKRQQLPSERWQQHERAHREALAAAEQLRVQIRGERSEHGRLKRVKSAMALVVRRRLLVRELGELGDVIRLREEFGEEARTAQDQWRLSEQSIISTRRVIEEIDTQLEGLDPPVALLEAGPEIERLQERLGAVEKASGEIGTEIEKRNNVEHRLLQLLRELGRPPEFERAEDLRLRADEQAIIRELGQNLAVLRGQSETARRTIARQEALIERLERERSELDATRDVEALRRAVRQIRKAGDLDSRLSDARVSLVGAEKAAELALARLPGWGNRTGDELRRLAAPLDVTIEQFDAKMQEAEGERRAVAERIQKEFESIRQVEEVLVSLDSDHDLPTQELLEAGRARRDAGWRLVKKAWLLKGQEENAADVRAFVAEFASANDETLATAYERSVDQADTVADRLRREADRVARKADYAGKLSRHRVVLLEQEEEQRLLEERAIAIDRNWAGVVGLMELGTEARTPGELRSWLVAREDVVARLEKADLEQQVVERLEREIDGHLATVRRMWEPGWPSPLSADSNLAEVLDHAELFIQRQDDLAKKSASIEAKLSAARQELASNQLSLQTAQAALEEWRVAWSAKMVRLGLEPDADPKQAESVLSHMTEMFENLEKRRECLSRIAGIHRDAELFGHQVTAQAARVAPDIGGESPAEMARELLNRLQSARADAQRRADLCRNREREQAALHASEKLHSQARVSLERLCKEAGCEQIEELTQAERRSQARIRVEHDLPHVKNNS